MVAIEGECGGLVELFEMCMKEFESDKHDSDSIYNNMVKIKAILTQQKKLMSRMTERCNPKLFYNVLRKYLWGSDKIEGGLELVGAEQIENEGKEPQYINVKINYGGGSAAQSSLIQAEDIFFGIKHPNDNFLLKMRDFMPEKHRIYIESMGERINMRNFLTKNVNNTSYDYQLLMPLYNECVTLISEFRKIHKGIVAVYIINQMNKDVENETGTGGTPLQTYLRTKVEETEKLIIEE